MAELHDDSVGPSAHLHGTEERSWKRFKDNLDLIDLYLIAVHRKGPVYTRQALSGARFDQARLDRAYCSNRGSWFEHVQSVEHDSQ